MTAATVDDYYIYLCGKSINDETRKNYLSFPREFLQHLNKPLLDITQEDVNQYVRYCIQHYRNNGNKTRFQLIQYFLNWTQTPLTLPKLRYKDIDKAVLNEEQMQTLFETVQDMSLLHQLILYLEYDGIRRPREIRHIQRNWRNDDVLYYNGKTHPDHIILSKRLMRVWDDYIAFERPPAVTPADDQYLLLNNHKHSNTTGKRIKSNNTIMRLIRDIFHESGIRAPKGEMPTNYLIKRTSITRQLKQCPDPKIIQLQAGHSTLEQTMKYNRVNDSDIRTYIHNNLDVHKNKTQAKQRNLEFDLIKTCRDLPPNLNKTLENENRNNDNACFSFSINSFLTSLLKGVVS